MASGGERRMLFDIRGKRKHVVRVVYAILALLMGASLFLVVGPVNIGSLLGNSNTATETTKIFEERAERLERELRKDPERRSQTAGAGPHSAQRRHGRRVKRCPERQPAGPRSARRIRSRDRRPGTPTKSRSASRTRVRRSPNWSPRPGCVLAENPSAGFEEAFESLERSRAACSSVYAEGKPSASSYSSAGALPADRRQLHRRRQVRQEGGSPRDVQGTAQRSLQTAGIRAQTGQEKPQEQEGNRQSRKGQRQGTARKPVRRPRRRQHLGHRLALGRGRRPLRVRVREMSRRRPARWRSP